MTHRPVGNDRRLHPGYLAQHGTENASIRMTSARLTRKMIQPYVQQGSEVLAGTVVPTHAGILPPFAGRQPARVHQACHPMKHFGVVRGNRATFAGGQVFGRLKAERPHIAQPADATSTVFCFVSLGTVLNDGQAVPAAMACRASMSQG